MNKLLFLVGRDEAMGLRIGILETPCYPAIYYAGYIQGPTCDPRPFCNETSLWHRTIESAIDAADAILKKANEKAKELFDNQENVT